MPRHGPTKRTKEVLRCPNLLSWLNDFVHDKVTIKIKSGNSWGRVKIKREKIKDER